MKHKSKNHAFENVVWTVERDYGGKPKSDVTKCLLIARINGWVIVRNARVSDNTVRAYPENDCYARRENAFEAAERERRRLGL